MDGLDQTRLMALLEATWPPAEVVERAGWRLRRGAGGGQRVSAASGQGDVAEAEAAMRAWDQAPLFQIGPGDGALDADLAARGYAIGDPTLFYVARAADLTGSGDHVAAGYRAGFRPAIMEEIWQAGGIGAARFAVMDRAEGPKLFLMGRVEDRPCGVAFVAVDGDAAMIHAVEVRSAMRRKGVAGLMLESAARWAQEQGAEWMTLAVTEANAAARALYAGRGMVEAGGYHYRREGASG